MDRRTFLKATGLSAGVAAAGPLLAACGGNATAPAGPGEAPASPRGPAAGPVPATSEQSEQTSLIVHQATFELLTGPDRYIAFGVTDQDNTDIGDAEVEVVLRTVPGQEGGGSPEVLAGPLPATRVDADDTGIGLFYVRADLERAGFTEVVATHGDAQGTAVFNVVGPEDSQIAVPGQDAVRAPTPTVDDDLGYFAICTQDPPCGMHEMSLDEALGTGRPVVLLFATPAFCQTAVCGPSVATLDQVRTSGDWGDVIFIHSEIYAEEPGGSGATAPEFTEAVEAWALPTEPWLFTIDADGQVVDRLDGPMPTPVVTDLVETVTT